MRRLLGTQQNASAIILLLFLLFVSHITAQGLPKLPENNDKAAATAGEAAAKTDTAKAAATDKDTKAAAKTTDKTDNAATTKAASRTTDEAPGLTGLPKLKGQDYPPPSVPPTAGAPFMQKSNLPEGTVFICVGAALGFFGAMVLAWRGFLAWSVHRSVKRSANAHLAKYNYDGKDPLEGLKKNGPYMSAGPGSALSLDQLAASGKGGGKAHSSNRSTLFFSPTAGAGMQAHGTRGSGYLPAGYYATGNAAPASGANMTHLGGERPLSNLGTGERRYSRGASRPVSKGLSPPHSPSLPPSRGVDSVLYSRRSSTQALVGQHSIRSLSNLSVAPQGRAPSAYLDDLFDGHTPPQTSGNDRRGSRRS